MVDVLRQDLRYALRGLRRSPVLSVAIVITIALALGVNVALFTVADRIFFQAPPGVVEPSAVRRLFAHQLGQGGREYTFDQFSTHDHENLAAASAGAASIEGYAFRGRRRVDDTPTPRNVAYATTRFFDVVGVRPYRGRSFSNDENIYGDPKMVVLLSHSMWLAAYGGDSAILGRAIRVDTSTFTVIGVLAPGFVGMDVDVVDLWAPLAALPSLGEGPWWTRGFQVMRLFARLAPDANASGLAERLNVAYRAGRPETVERDPGVRLEMAPLLQARSSLRYGRQDERNIALLQRLLGIGAIILIVGMSNVASLLLMRAIRRRREMAVRLALGVSRGRLVMLLFLESLVLSAIGGGASLFLTWITGDSIRQLLIANIQWPATLIDARVVAFTLIVTLVVAIGGGLAPATLAWKPDLMRQLRIGAFDTGRSGSRLRLSLLAAQTALCTLLLVAAGVFIQSLRRASSLDLGFDRDRLITVQLNAMSNVVSMAADRIAALPGVESVGRSSVDLRGGMIAGISFKNGDSIPAIMGPVSAEVNEDYGRAIGARLLEGRWISATDRGPSEPIVVINHTMANAYWPGRSPLGECFFVVNRSGPCRRIVGVVGDVRWDLTESPQRWFYVPMAQSYAQCCSTLTVRTRARATATTLVEIRRVLSEMGAWDAAPPTPRLVSERHEPIMRPWRVTGGMFLIFGALALAACAAGIYGLVAYDVTQRTHELGVRMVLGATSPDLLALVVMSGAKTVFVGLGIGVVASFATGRLLSSLLYETSAYDVFALALTTISLLVVATIASLLPALKATRIDAAQSLRVEG
jgi:putative ABC transport system permease protein